MKITLTIFSLLYSIAGFAKSSESVNVCFQDYREEMATAAVLFANSQNYFEDQGVKVNLVKFNTSTKPVDLMKSSNFNEASPKRYFNGMYSEVDLLQKIDELKCDFVSTTFESVLASNISLEKIKPVAVYRYGKDYDTHLVVRKDSDIKSIKDLKGKVLRINQVGSIIAFENILKDSGISSQDVVYKSVKLQDIPRALDNKEIDAVLSYNPTIPLLLGSDRVRILEENIFSKQYANSIPHSLLVVTKKYADKNKKGLAKFVKAFSTGAAELSKRPENIIYAFPHVSSAYTNVQIEKSLSFVKVSLPVIESEVGKKEFLNEANFSAYQNVLHSRGFIKSVVDLKPWQ